MKKSSRPELDREAVLRIITLAREERKPFDEIKKVFGLAEKEVTEIMRKQLTVDDFESWKKKVAAKKPKPVTQFNIIQEDELDSRYYIRNKF